MSIMVMLYAEETPFAYIYSVKVHHMIWTLSINPLFCDGIPYTIIVEEKGC